MRSNTDLILDVEHVCDDWFNDASVTVGEGNGSCYVFGYIIRQLLRLHPCDICSSCLVSDSSIVENDKQLYTSMKAYHVKGKHNSFGNLFVSTSTFYNYLMTCDAIFSEYFAIHAADNNIVTNLCEKLKCIQLQGVCSNYPKDAILKSFAKLRIYYTLKYSNRDFVSYPKKQRKLLKINSL
jgi:hypothetical protein